MNEADARGVKRKVLAILRILSEAEEPRSARILSQQLEGKGIKLSERAVRYHLKLTDERGLTRRSGGKGRVITPQGREELQIALVTDRLGLVSVRMEFLAFRTSFDPRTQLGRVPVNISFFRREDFFPALQAMAPVFQAGLAVTERVAVVGEGKKLGEMTVPRGKVGLATVCSLIVSGLLLKAGIPVESRFGGVLEIEGRRPVRFVELISYTGSSLDPSEVFIRGRMTQVRGAVGGQGKVLASFCVIPAPCCREAERLIRELREAGIGGVLSIGEPNEPLCEIPVAVGRVGVVLLGGLNPVAAAAEAGIDTENRAMASIMDFSQLQNFRGLVRG